MKNIITEFLRRGFTACGFGPMLLAMLYLILQQQGAVEMLTVNQVCTGIFSLTALAFIAGGMNVIYQVERLPLMAAIFIHGSVLYFGYLGTYLINNWLERSITPILVFTAFFLPGYLVVWIVIYCLNKRNTEKLNRILTIKQHNNEG